MRLVNPQQTGSDRRTTTVQKLLKKVAKALIPWGVVLEVWPESHWPGFALRQADVIQSYTAW